MAVAADRRNFIHRDRSVCITMPNNDFATRLEGLMERATNIQGHIDLAFWLADHAQAIAKVAQCADAVVRRWETPTWKDAPATAEYIYALRDALAELNGQIGNVPDALAKARAVVNEQAEDGGLWFAAETITEAMLQRALRRLHAVVEGDDDAAELLRHCPPPP